jgi:sulfur-oxidizing protein SoxZ
MSDVGRVRIRVPSMVRPGEVIKVRCLVIHPMERLEPDKQGNILQKRYNYISQATVTYRGKPVVTLDVTQSVSENPIFTFPVKVTEPGQLKVTFVDTAGGRYEGTADIKFA